MRHIQDTLLLKCPWSIMDPGTAQEAFAKAPEATSRTSIASLKRFLALAAASQGWLPELRSLRSASYLKHNERRLPCIAAIQELNFLIGNLVQSWPLLRLRGCLHLSEAKSVLGIGGFGTPPLSGGPFDLF